MPRAARGMRVPLGFTARTAAAEDHREQRRCAALASEPPDASALAGAAVGLSLGQQRRCCCAEGLFPCRPLCAGHSAFARSRPQEAPALPCCLPPGKGFVGCTQRSHSQQR